MIINFKTQGITKRRDESASLQLTLLCLCCLSFFRWLMEYTSDVDTCIDMIKYEMFCVNEINLVKMKSDKLIICVAFSQYCYSLT